MDKISASILLKNLAPEGFAGDERDLLSGMEKFL